MFEEFGMEYAGDVEVLVLYGATIDDAVEVLGGDAENPYPLDDNGGAPDGPSWYVEADSIASEIVAQIEANRFGYRANARIITGYDGTDEQKRELNDKFPFRWCGYTSRQVAYARDANE